MVKENGSECCKKIVVLLPEEIPSQNKGEAAILYGMIESLRSFCTPKLINISKYKDDLRYNKIPGVKSIHYPLIHKEHGIIYALIDVFLVLLLGALQRSFGKNVCITFFKQDVWRAFIESDLVLIGHDNVFCPTITMRNIPLALYAKLAGKTLACYGASIGPLKGGLKERRVCSLVLSLFDLITLRDSHSLEEIKKLGLHPKAVEVTADLAFLMRPDESGEMERVMSKSDYTGLFDKPVIIVTATKYLAEKMSKADGRKLTGFDEKYEAFLHMMSVAIDEVTSEHDVNVLLLAHVVGPIAKQDDRITNNDIAQRVSNRDRLFILNDDLNADVLKKIISRASFLIGTRTHSMIAALSQGVPVLAITDSGRYKTNGIFQKLCLDKLLVNIEDICFAEFSKKVRDMFALREVYAKQLAEQLPAYIDEAKHNGTLLSEALSKQLN